MDMISVSTIGEDGYENIQLVYKWKGEALFSGVQKESKNQVFLKYYESLSSAALQEVTKRFNVFKNSSSPYQANVYDLIEITRKEAEDRILTFEASGDPSLKQYLRNHKLSIENILKIGIQLSEAVADLHEAGIIHAGLRPSTITINPASQNIKINDVGLLSGDNFLDEDVYQQDMVADVLPYISPEQSGRTSNIIDHRADLYSIGIILYECLTRRVPFMTDDPLKLIHAHLAQDPPELSKIDKKIPSTLSKIIQKLLSKAPEDRYSGAWGVKTDLKRCRMQWQDSGYISEFDLARVDVPHILKTSQKIFGREAELRALWGAFERVNREGQELTLIKGASGIGKSVLVNEFKNRLLKSRQGYFISGKFSQMKRNIPYEPLIQALDEMIRQILSESAEQIEDWKNRLQDALGPNGQVVIEVLPDLELIIGDQPETPKLGTVESQNRFNFVLGNFITALTTEDKPLILFIDDLQWADSSSLTIDSQYLLILGAFRDNEVDASHPLSLTLERIQNAGGLINEIRLHPLEHQDVNQLLSETIVCNPENTKELARVCVEKTHGNPFFLDQFIKSLHRQHLLSFDAKLESWKWSVDKIRKNQVTDNVVEYMTAEINRLSSQTQTAMTFAACLGSEFKLGTFSSVIKKSSEEALAYLKEALDKELILSIKSTDVRDEMSFRFLHDRVHQAAYSLIDKDQKAKLHLKIGRFLFGTTPEDQLEERIFNIVYQLNNGSKLIETIKEKEDLTKLNLVAANKARASAAYGPAFDYLMTGMTLLEKECWEKQYELTLSLYETAAETAYLNGHFDKTYDFANVVIKRAHKILDTLKVYDAKIRAYAMANNFPESVKTGLEILKKLGVKFPQKPNDFHLISSYIRTKIATIGKGHHDIKKFPEVTDPNIVAIMRILRPVGISAYLSDPKLMVLIILKGSHLMMKHGHDSEALFTDMYGLVLCLFGDIDNGYRYAKTGLDLIEKFNSRAIESHIQVNFNAFIRHWKEHIKNNLSPLLDAYNKSIETGNLEFAGYASLMYCIDSYFCGRHLGTLESESKKYGKFMKQIKQDTTFRHNQILHQTLLNLMGENDNPIYLIGSQYDENKMLPVHLEANDESALFDMHFHKMMLSFLFDEHEMAVENAETSKKYLEAVLVQPETPIFHFYDSLIQLAIVTNKSKSEKRVIFRRVAKNQKKMKKWAHHAPMNCRHKYHLVEAERYRLKGKNEAAIHHYDKAIDNARENEYIQEQALANELAAKFYMAQNKATIAGAYLLKARECYLKWGAYAKVRTTYLQEDS